MPCSGAREASGSVGEAYPWSARTSAPPSSIHSRVTASLRTDAVKLSKKPKGLGGSLSFSKDYRAEHGSRLALKYLEALESPEKEDSEIQLVVVATDSKGVELGEIGVAHCSLEELVEKNQDHEGGLDIVKAGGKTSTVVGTLTCDIIAVAALRAVEAASDKPPSPRVEEARRKSRE